MDGHRPLFAIDHIVQVTSFGSYQKRWLNETLACSACCDDFLRCVRPASLASPLFQQPQRVVPQCIDFDGLAATRSHDPVADFGIHPGELIAFCPLAEQSVAGSTPMPKRVPRKWCLTISRRPATVAQRDPIVGA